MKSALIPQSLIFFGFAVVIPALAQPNLQAASYEQLLTDLGNPSGIAAALTLQGFESPSVTVLRADMGACNPASAQAASVKAASEHDAFQSGNTCQAEIVLKTAQGTQTCSVVKSSALFTTLGVGDLFVAEGIATNCQK